MREIYRTGLGASGRKHGVEPALTVKRGSYHEIWSIRVVPPDFRSLVRLSLIHILLEITGLSRSTFYRRMKAFREKEF